MSFSNFYLDPFADAHHPFFDDPFSFRGRGRGGGHHHGGSRHGHGGRGHESTGPFKPDMDLHESAQDNRVTATFDLPGLKKEDISIDIHNNRLVISGQSTSATEENQDGYAVRERRYGKFSRMVPLPTGIKAEDIKASMQDGVLTVSFPKTGPEQAPQRITIS